MPIQITNALEYDYGAVNLPNRPKGSTPLVHTWGFDPTAKYQRIAAPSARRLLSTKGGSVAGLSFKVTGPPNIKIVSEDMSFKGTGGREGLVCIEGVTAGAGTKLELQNAAGKTIDAIDVEVAPFVGIKVRYYNLIDGKGRHGVSTVPFAPVPADFNGPALTDLTDNVNSIVATQCDCFLAANGKGAIIDLGTPKDMKNQVDINDVNIFSFGDMDADAQYHVIFVWSIAGGHSNGITRSNVTLLDASLSLEKRPITLAHEFVHFLSGSGVVTVGDHDDQNSDLLFRTAPHGINLRKSRLQKILGLRKATP